MHFHSFAFCFTSRIPPLLQMTLNHVLVDQYLLTLLQVPVVSMNADLSFQMGNWHIRYISLVQSLATQQNFRRIFLITWNSNRTWFSNRWKRPWDIRGKVYLVIVRLVPLSKVVWRQVLICSSFHDIVHSASTGVTCVLIMSTVMLFEYMCVLLFLLLAVGIDSQSK